MSSARRAVVFYPDQWLADTIGLSHTERSVLISLCAAQFSHNNATVPIREVKRLCPGRGVGEAIRGLVARGLIARTKIGDDEAVRAVTRRGAQLWGRLNGAKRKRINKLDGHLATQNDVAMTFHRRENGAVYNDLNGLGRHLDAQNVRSKAPLRHENGAQHNEINGIDAHLATSDDEPPLQPVLKENDSPTPGAAAPDERAALVSLFDSLLARRAESNTAKPAKPARARAKPIGTRLPADFVLPQAWIEDGIAARARRNLPPVDPMLQWDLFFNWSQSSASPNARKIDWHKTWITWILKATEEHRANGNGRPKAPTAAENLYEGGWRAAQRAAARHGISMPPRGGVQSGVRPAQPLLEGKRAAGD